MSKKISMSDAEVKIDEGYRRLSEAGKRGKQAFYEELERQVDDEYAKITSVKEVSPAPLPVPRMHPLTECIRYAITPVIGLHWRKDFEDTA